jgi:hypothetical protein
VFREACDPPELTLPLLGKVCRGGFTLLGSADSLTAGVGVGSHGKVVILNSESFCCHAYHSCQQTLLSKWVSRVEERIALLAGEANPEAGWCGTGAAG